MCEQRSNYFRLRDFFGIDSARVIAIESMTHRCAKNRREHEDNTVAETSPANSPAGRRARRTRNGARASCPLLSNFHVLCTPACAKLRFGEGGQDARAPVETSDICHGFSRAGAGPARRASPIEIIGKFLPEQGEIFFAFIRRL
ncbi:MAG: hypothetical protein ABSC92_05715 [Rhizomicrobium sp.]